MGKKRGLFKLLVGIAAGTAIGALFAPSKGKTLRDRIKKEREEGRDGSRAVGKHLKGMTKDMGDTAMDAAEKAGIDGHINKVGEHAKKAGETFKKHAKKAEEHVKSFADKLKKDKGKDKE